MSCVVSLLDRAPVACADQQELGQWLLSWAQAAAEGEFGKFRSIVVVLESDDGRVATLSQSLGAMDMPRLVGLLMCAAHRKLDGNASIEDLREI